MSAMGTGKGIEGYGGQLRPHKQVRGNAGIPKGLLAFLLRSKDMAADRSGAIVAEQGKLLPLQCQFSDSRCQVPCNSGKLWLLSEAGMAAKAPLR